MRISDWSSDVCSSDLAKRQPPVQGFARNGAALVPLLAIGAIAAQVFPGEAGRTQVHHVQIGSRRLPGGVLHVVSCASTGDALAAVKATDCFAQIFAGKSRRVADRKCNRGKGAVQKRGCSNARIRISVPEVLRVMACCGRNSLNLPDSIAETGT